MELLLSFSDKNLLHKEPFTEINDLGVGIELVMSERISIKSCYNFYNTYKNIAEHIRNSMSIHGPVNGLFFNNLDYFENLEVQNKMDIFYDMVKKLNPKIVVLHSGYNKLVAKTYTDKNWKEKVVDFWKKEVKRYSEIDVKVVLENIVEPNPDLLLSIIDNVNSDYFGICLDVGHANSSSKLSPSEWVKQIDNKLFHVHIHDNHGFEDQHLPIGDGNIDYNRFFSTLQKVAPKACVALEINADYIKIIENLKFILSNYF